VRMLDTPKYYTRTSIGLQNRSLSGTSFVWKCPIIEPRTLPWNSLHYLKSPVKLWDLTQNHIACIRDESCSPRGSMSHRSSPQLGVLAACALLRSRGLNTTVAHGTTIGGSLRSGRRRYSADRPVPGGGTAPRIAPLRESPHSGWRHRSDTRWLWPNGRWRNANTQR
jgi:hypothetical protein